MCSAQQNPPRTVPGVNPETIVLYTAKINSCNPPGSLILKGSPPGTRPRYPGSLWSQGAKSWFFFFFSFCPLPPFTEALLISQRLTMPCAHPWPSHEIPAGPQQGPKGDSSNRSLCFSTREVPGDWSCNGSSSSQCDVWEDTLRVFGNCAICEVHSSTKGLLISKSEGLWLLAWGWGDGGGLGAWDSDSESDHLTEQMRSCPGFQNAKLQIEPKSQ